MKATHSLNLVEVAKIINNNLDKERSTHFKVKEVLAQDIQNVIDRVSEKYSMNRKNTKEVTRARFALLSVSDAIYKLERANKASSKEYTLLCKLYDVKTIVTCPYCTKKFATGIFGYVANTCGKARCTLADMRENI